MNTKACNVCGVTKSLEDFYRYNTRKNRPHYATCKECQKARTRKWLDNNPESKAVSGWKQRGIDCTWEQFEQMLQEQDSVCKLCRKPAHSGSRLAVDHNHESGEVRGLLCLSCNQLIGKIENGTVPFTRLITYLEKEVVQWLSHLPTQTLP